MEVLARCGGGAVYKTDLRLSTRLAHNLYYTVEDLNSRWKPTSNAGAWTLPPPGLGTFLSFLLSLPVCCQLSRTFFYKIMSSINLAKLVIDDEDDDWGAISPLPSTSSRPSSIVSSSASLPTASTGEFNLFSTVGALLSGGGVKREVWFLEEGDLPCLGKVGVSNTFCIKPCEPGKPHCGTLRHGVKFPVSKNMAYIQASDTQMYCIPSLDLDLLSFSQQELLCQASFTPAEWGQFFKSVQGGNTPDWLIVDEAINKKDADFPDNNEELHLLSPAATKFKHRAFEILPTFSYDSTVSEEDNKNAD
jgi:hypothetical protein